MQSNQSRNGGLMPMVSKFQLSLVEATSMSDEKAWYERPKIPECACGSKQRVFFICMDIKCPDCKSPFRLYCKDCQEGGVRHDHKPAIRIYVFINQMSQKLTQMNAEILSLYRESDTCYQQF